MLDLDRERSRATALHVWNDPENNTLSDAKCADCVGISYGMGPIFVEQAYTEGPHEITHGGSWNG